MLRPTSGNFLGPKTMAATPAITTSSGTPNPKRALQVKPLLFLLNCCSCCLRGVIENLEMEEQREEEEEKDRCCCCCSLGAIGVGIEIEEEEEENETQFIIAIISSI
jgi:hypothetical protein